MSSEPTEPFEDDPSNHGREVGERATVSLVAEVRFGTGEWRRSRLIDLSETGFRLAWAPQGRPGAAFAIRIAGLQMLSGTVRWRDTSGIGCEFDRPLSPYVFEHLARMAGI